MKKYIFGAVLSLGILVSPAFTQAAALTTGQANSLIAVVQAAPGIPASAFVNLITAFSNITVNQATSLIAVVQAAPGVAPNAFVNLLISFTIDTSTQAATPATNQTVTPTATTASPAINYFTVSGSQVTAGQGITATWSASSVNNCSILRNEANGGRYMIASNIGTATSYAVYPTNSSSYVLSCLGFADNSGKDAPAVERTFSVSVATPAPSATCQVTQQTSAVYTNPFTISWSSTNATYGVASSGDKIDPSGSATYQLASGEEKSYTFTFFNADGKSTSCSTFFSSIKG